MTPSEVAASTGIEQLDLVLGGLYWGDNVVWEVGTSGAVEPFYRAVSRRADEYDRLVYVAVSEDPATVRRRYREFEVLDARPGGDLAPPAALLKAIAERFDRPQRVLLLFDPLEAMASLWGAESAGHFFARCCPMLLDLGAVAYWSLSRGDVPAALRRVVEDVTQCVLVLEDGRLRIAEAQGRPPGVVGTVFRYRAEEDVPTVVPAPASARVGAALRALRLERQLSQAELARLAGVSPSAISQAERGERGLSLETLLALAGRLNITLDELLRGEARAGYRLGRRPDPGSRARGEAVPLPLLDDPNAGLRAYVLRLPPRGSAAPPIVHKGVELVAVGEGLVQVQVSTGRPVLRRGEVLLAEESAVHGWRNLGLGEAVVFWILRDGRAP